MFKKLPLKAGYYNYTTSKYNSAKTFVMQYPLQQLFIPLLPLLFWFLCFSTIDPYHNHDPMKPPFSRVFKTPTLSIPTPSLIPATEPKSQSQSASPTWQSVIIKSGTSLADIFAKYQLDPKQLQAVLNSSPLAQKLELIKPGQKIELLIDDKQQLLSLNYYINKTDTLQITASDDGSFKANLEQITPKKTLGYAEGIIKSSFYVAAQKTGLSNKQIANLVKAFNSRIDFARDIHPGTSFRVLYDQESINGKKIRSGDIIAAEFKTSKDQSYKIIRYTDPKGRTDYYTPDGNSTSLAFIRKPIANARISSPFSLRRIHPILHTPMPHYGTDFASPIGTPIKATGNGEVAFVGKQNGYGNVVIIQHNQRISTLYAHMSRFAKNMKAGTRVKLGQVIGYVGMTGRADGPHVHYEFRINGKHYDPMKVQLPHSESIPKNYRQDFMAKLAKLSQLLQAHKP